MAQTPIQEYGLYAVDVGNHLKRSNNLNGKQDGR